MSLSLALDALESVRHHPTSSLLWQALTQHGLNLAEAERRTLLQRMTLLPNGPGPSEWLRCSALAHLTDDTAWLARQAACADASYAADAIMSFLGLVWGKALLESPSHQAFSQLLIDVGASRLQGLVASQIAAPAAAGPRPTGKPLRVAVYTPEIANLHHGGTALTLRVLALLARLGHTVRAFSAKEVSIPHTAAYHGGMEFIEPLPVQIDALHLPSGADIQLKLWDHRYSLRSRFDKALQAIVAFAPDVLLFVGFLSPLIQALHARFPVLALSVHALPPLVPVDVWLSAQPEGTTALWPDLPPSLAFPFPYRFMPAGKVGAVERRTAGLPADATVLVSAGFRLDREVLPPWSGQMRAFLDAHPQAHWLLIGVAESQQLQALAPHPRIHTLPPQHNLAAWLAMADIYVNPPRVGGGGSVAMAMEQGLAVASRAGGDGGDKLGDWAASTDERYFSLLSAWVHQPDTRREVGEALRGRFKDRLDLSGANALEGLTQACREAIGRHRWRSESAHA